MGLLVVELGLGEASGRAYQTWGPPPPVAITPLGEGEIRATGPSHGLPESGYEVACNHGRLPQSYPSPTPGWLAVTLKMEFDRGTLLLESSAPERLPADLPGVRWDPRVHCHRAPARFYSRLVDRLRADGIAVEDRVLALYPRQAVACAAGLRPYQEAALDAWRLAGRRGVVSLPTGSGKTYVAAAAIAACGGSALCLVPTRILLEQWRRVLAASLRVPVGCYGDGEHESRPLTVATFESAWRHMRDLGNRFELLVVDEVHHFGCGVRDEALEMSTAPFRLGLTATPDKRLLASRLVDLIGPLVFEVELAALTGSYLAEYRLVDIHLDLDPQERREYESARRTFAAVYDQYRLLGSGTSWRDFLRWAARTPQGRAGVEAWRRARRVVSLPQSKRSMLAALLRRHRESRVLVFTADKIAAYRIAHEFLIMPITADIRSRERNEMLTAFRQGNIRALVSARVLNEGFDVPAADVGIVVGGSLGEREHTQRVGRLLRPADGKQAVVYELVIRGSTEVPQARRRNRGLS